MTLDPVYSGISKSDQEIADNKDYIVNVFAFMVKKMIVAAIDYKIAQAHDTHECFIYEQIFVFLKHCSEKYSFKDN